MWIIKINQEEICNWLILKVQVRDKTINIPFMIHTTVSAVIFRWPFIQKLFFNRQLEECLWDPKALVNLELDIAEINVTVLPRSLQHMRASRKSRSKYGIMVSLFF